MNVIINDRPCEAEYGEYILEVAIRNGIDIPTICHSDALPGLGNCRLCMVEISDAEKSKVVAACIYPVTKEMTVRTESYRK